MSTGKVVVPSPGVVKASRVLALREELRCRGWLRDVEAICIEEGVVLEVVLDRWRGPAICRARWRCWLGLNTSHAISAEQIATLWRYSESAIWYGLKAAATGHDVPRSPTNWLDEHGHRELAEDIAAEEGVCVAELVSHGQQPRVVEARHRMWRELAALGRSATWIAERWAMTPQGVRWALRMARKEAA